MHKEYIWITDDWSQAYYHWFTEALPRLIFMNNYLETKTLLLPNNYKNKEFIVKSLYHLKIKKIKYIDKRKKVIKNLIIAPHLAPSGDNNKYYLQELRNLFLKSFNKYINCSSNDRIYISRSKAEKRKVSNEKEIQPILKKYGFKIINFEDYSWEKQIRICLNAKYMIGIHGAGLTNSIFMKKNSSILELRDEIKQPKCYMKMADSLNFKYKNQICHLSSSNQKSPNGNYIVNKKNLEKNIKVILENEL
jgi:capsular polysaccharide biosynthesis protein